VWAWEGFLGVKSTPMQRTGTGSHGPRFLTPAISKLPPIAVKCGTIYQLGQMRIFQYLISLFNPKAVLPEPKVFKHLLSLGSNHLSY